MYEQIREQIQQLLEFELYESAESLITLFLSGINQENQSETVRLIQCELIEQLGDISYRKNEFKRALFYYKQSFQLSKFSFSARTFKSNPGIDTIQDSRIKFKEAKCHIQLKDNQTAIKEIETIPIHLRNPGMNLNLGNLYKQSNMIYQAIGMYKEVVKVLPTCVEAIESLIILKEPVDNVVDTIQSNSGHVHFHEITKSQDWFQILLSALSQKRFGEFEKAIDSFRALLNIFPRNKYLLAHLASAALEGNQLMLAKNSYQIYRKIDPFTLKGLDSFGFVLFQIEDCEELGKLARDMMALDPSRAQCWLVAGLHCELQGQSEKALSFIEKAVSLDPRHSLGLCIRGRLLLSHGHPKEAALTFTQANALCKDIFSFSGLVEANISVGRLGEALRAAKEALLSMPRSSAAFTLMAELLANAKGGANESLKAFSEALRLCPSNQRAQTSLAALLSSQLKEKDAVQKLRQALLRSSSPTLRLQVARSLVSLRHFSAALEQLQIAIVEGCEEASQELERVEQLIRKENESPLPADQSDDWATDGAEESWEGTEERQVSQRKTPKDPKEARRILFESGDRTRERDQSPPSPSPPHLKRSFKREGIDRMLFENDSDEG